MFVVTVGSKLLNCAPVACALCNAFPCETWGIIAKCHHHNGARDEHRIHQDECSVALIVVAISKSVVLSHPMLQYSPRLGPLEATALRGVLVVCVAVVMVMGDAPTVDSVLPPIVFTEFATNITVHGHGKAFSFNLQTGCVRFRTCTNYACTSRTTIIPSLLWSRLDPTFATASVSSLSHCRLNNHEQLASRCITN